MRRRNCKLRDFSCQGSKINCARFSRKIVEDGGQSNRHEYFVTGDNHNNIRFYQFIAEEELMSFTSNANSAVQSQVSAVAISWEETSIFSGSNRGIINVWDVLQGKNAPVCTLKGHATAVNCFGLFPQQENRIASGSYDTHIKLWDVRQKNNYAMLKHHTKQINSIDISPDGLCLLSGSEDCTTKLWDLRSTQKVLCTYAEHTAPIIKSMFNPEDCMFASCSADRTVKYFSCDKNKGAYLYVSTTELVSMPITAIDFSTDGNLLCTAGNDILKIWDMRKNGVLVQSIDSAWKGVQDILWCEKGIKGISSYGGNLSVWFCYLGDQTQNFQKKQQEPSQLKFPKILKNPSIRRQSSSLVDERKIKPAQQYSSNKQLDENPKLVQRNKDLQQVMNNVNLALGHLNNLTQLKNKQKQQKQKQEKREQEQKRKEQDRLKQQERKQRIRLQKQKQKEEKQKKQRERKQRIQKQKQQQQKSKQEKLQQMERQRAQRQRLLRERINETFQKNNNFECTLENDVLENSSVMNISTFMGDGVQKQKLMQMQAIGQFLKQSSRFESMYKLRSSYIKPIIHFWKQGKIDSALYTLGQAEIAVAYDCISAILHNNTFKMGITPDVACALIKKLVEIMHNKHSTYVRNSMSHLNQIVLMFKDQLIKVKMFNPMSKVDLSRQEKLAKYDRLTEEFLNVFKQERLKKYATAKNMENQQVFIIASELYKNLEEVLRKIMPRNQPQAA